MLEIARPPAEQLCCHLAQELCLGMTGYPGSGEVCQVIVGDEASGSHGVSLRLLPHGVEIGEVLPRSADATVWIPGDVLQELLKEAQKIDLRDRRIHASIRYEGNPRLVTLMGQALLRPSPEVQRVYKAAEQRARRAAPVPRVERVHRPTEGALFEAFAASRPLVATGLLDSCLPGTWEELTRRFGNMLIEPPSLGQSLPLSGFIERVLTPWHESATYSEGCKLPESFARELRPSIERTPSAAGALGLGEPRLWAGVSDGREVVTGLHRDPGHGLLAQVLGRKQVLLFAPHEGDNLYAGTAFNSFQNCWVDPLKPRLEVHPKFRNARRLDVELGPGDVLALPAGWFHGTVIDGPSFSVSFPVSVSFDVSGR